MEKAKHEKKQNRNLREKLQKDRISVKEVVLMVAKGLVIILVIAYLFYDDWLFALFLSPLLYFFVRMEYAKLCQKKQDSIASSFKEALLAILASLKAGYSVENAFGEAYKDMRYRFGDDNFMVEKLLEINRQVKNNIPIEKLMMHLASQVESEDIRDFAEIFMIAKRSGGDMGKILNRTIGMIARRMEMQESIALMVAAKKMEQQIMNMVPFGIIFYIRLTNGSYFDTLYHTPVGIGIMTAALTVYGVSYVMADKILKIKV